MTSTNNKKNPVAYDPTRHLYYSFDAQHDRVQFCQVRGKKDHGEWVDLSGVRKLTPDEVARGAIRVLPTEVFHRIELIDQKTSCTMGVPDQMFRRARAWSKQLKRAFRSGCTEYVGA